MFRAQRTTKHSRRVRPQARPAIENLETRALLSAPATDFPIIDSGQVPFRVKLTPVSIPNAPGLQSAAVAQANGKWLFIGGRTNGLHNFGPGQDFPPQFQNTNIIVVDPKTGQVWTRAWNASTLSSAAVDCADVFQHRIPPARESAIHHRWLRRRLDDERIHDIRYSHLGQCFGTDQGGDPRR